jgi:hypothetical protein
MKYIKLLFLWCLLFTLPLMAQDEYGVGVTEEVPYVAPGTLILDGVADEAAWADALTLDLTANWDGAWSGHPDPDVSADAKVLWTNDTLFVFAWIQDYQDFWWGGEGNPWGGEQILIGVDGTHAGDDQINEDWAGWPLNAPDKGPTTYKVWRDGITLDWGYWGIEPVDSGWVRGTVIVDDDNYEWGVEMAIYLPQITGGAKIGFNIGGASADVAMGEESESGDGAYAFFSWQVAEYAGGDVMRNAGSFATLNMVSDPSSVERIYEQPIPDSYALLQNYPNPFNPETRIQYSIPNAAYVQLSIYNVLGQQIAVLVDGMQSMGTYEASWNATGVTSGVYFYQLQIDNHIVDTKRMVLMK